MLVREFPVDTNQGLEVNKRVSLDVDVEAKGVLPIMYLKVSNFTVFCLFFGILREFSFIN